MGFQSITRASFNKAFTMASTINPSTPDVEIPESSVLSVQIHGKELEKEVKSINADKITTEKAPKREIEEVLNEWICNSFLIFVLLIEVAVCIILVAAIVVAIRVSVVVGIVGGRIGAKVFASAINLHIADLERYVIHLHLMS
jgi:hypothetical protein